MVRTRWVLLIFLAVAVATLGFAQSTAHHKKSRKPKPVKQMVLPPLPPGPLQQVPLDQLPAVPPQVSYQNGNLTIVAENSTLGDILREVRKRTGASIDVPGNANERVATRLGPGSARDVLATLLNGTSFNYVMVGSAKDPAVLASVVLTQRPASGATETAQNQPTPPPAYTPPVRADFGPGTGRPGFAPPTVQPPQVAQATADNGDDKDDDDSDDSDQEQGAEAQPGAQQIQQPPDQTDQNGQPGQPNVGPRTPQQILQMLQQQRQQQQQQQQQNPSDQQPPQQ